VSNREKVLNRPDNSDAPQSQGAGGCCRAAPLLGQPVLLLSKALGDNSITIQVVGAKSVEMNQNDLMELVKSALAI